MPPAYCNCCGKKFQDTARVLNHMNQPYSSCRTYFEEVLQIAEEVRQVRDGHPQKPHSSSDLANDSEAHHETFGLPEHGPTPEDEDDHMHDVPGPTNDGNPFFQEFYPGASRTFGTGQTFIDIFDSDKFAEQREQFPYYPFSSKHEWELASFLLRSGLSMAAIDKFFKLQLVSYRLCHEY